MKSLLDTIDRAGQEPAVRLCLKAAIYLGFLLIILDIATRDPWFLLANSVITAFLIAMRVRIALRGQP